MWGSRGRSGMEATRGRALSSAPTAIQLCRIRVARCSERAARTAVAAGRAARTGSLQWWLWGEACPGTRVGSSHLALRRAGRRARRGAPAISVDMVPLSWPHHAETEDRWPPKTNAIPLGFPSQHGTQSMKKSGGKETAPRCGGGGGGGGGRHCCGCRCCGCCGVENLTPHA